MQLVDPTLLISVVGIPAKQLKRALRQEINVYSRATSGEGLLCIRKYWDSHCSTFSKFPAIALLDQSSCPRGISDSDFVGLLSRLTDLQQWQIWDLWEALDIHSCGFVGCQEFTLLVVLMCAAMSQQQLQAVHAYQDSICRVFAGPHVGNTLSGLGQCCQLLDLPFACLVAALQQLQSNLLCLPGSRSCCQQTSSSQHCCSCSTCSCRHLGGVKMGWKAEAGSSGKQACMCSSRAVDSKSSSGPCSSCSSSMSGRSCCACSSGRGPGEKEASSAKHCAAVRQGAACPTSWPAISGQDVQLVLYCTIQLAHSPLEFAAALSSSSSSSNSNGSSSHSGGTLSGKRSTPKGESLFCVGCIVS